MILFLHSRSVTNTGWHALLKQTGRETLVDSDISDYTAWKVVIICGLLDV